MLRAAVNPKYLYEERWTDLERCLLLDGYRVIGDYRDGYTVVAVDPMIEETAPLDDDLSNELNQSDLADREEIIRLMKNSADNFRAQPPDFNGSLTSARVSLETLAKNIAGIHQTKNPMNGDPAKFGAIVAYLCNQIGFCRQRRRRRGVVGVYSFVSPGAHVPIGFTEEEMVRLGRSMIAAMCYFLMKNTTDRAAFFASRCGCDKRSVKVVRFTTNGSPTVCRYSPLRSAPGCGGDLGCGVSFGLRPGFKPLPFAALTAASNKARRGPRERRGLRRGNFYLAIAARLSHSVPRTVAPITALISSSYSYSTPPAPFSACQVLLVAHLLIRRNEQIEACFFGRIQQSSILQTRPSLIPSCRDRMAVPDEQPQILRNAFVEDDLHPTRDVSAGCVLFAAKSSTLRTCSRVA